MVDDETRLESGNGEMSAASPEAPERAAVVTPHVDDRAIPQQIDRPIGRYVVGLALIALVAVVSSLMTSAALDKQQRDAAALSMATNQVLLARELAEDAASVAVVDAELRAEAVADLTATWSDLSRTHRGLIDGDDDLGLPGDPSPRLRAGFAAMETHVAKLQSAVDELTLMASTTTNVDAHADRVATAAGLFEAAMEATVFEYQSEAEARIADLKQRQFILLSLTFIVLILEALFLFRPAARAVQRTWDRQAELHRTEREEHRRRLAYLAQYDPLTGLVNRSLFMDRLESAVRRARREGTLVSLMFLDLDHFKSVNDRYGHATGDALLRQVGARLTESVRESDTVARLGGDEFTVLLEGAHRVEDAGPVATKIIERLAVPYVVGHRELHITASIGISLYPLDGDDAQDLLKDADIAMYSAKSAGRNTYEYFTPELREQTAERLRIVDGLRAALDAGDQLGLYYQPKLDTTTGSVIGVEALLRWEHPDLGLILPERFVRLAEESNLIIPLGEWVLETACAQIAVWRRRGLRALPVSVNVSSRHFRQGDLVATLAETLARWDVDPALLEIELTESAILEDTEAVRRTLERVREIGVRIAIDDFGTGYSSLAYLKRFPIDSLKIDRSFVDDIIDNRDDASISAAIVGLAQSLRLDVIAEGVETPEQQSFLEELGCSKMQGFLISHPLPPAELEHFLGAHTPA